MIPVTMTAETAVRVIMAQGITKAVIIDNGNRKERRQPQGCSRFFRFPYYMLYEGDFEDAGHEKAWMIWTYFYCGFGQRQRENALLTGIENTSGCREHGGWAMERISDMAVTESMETEATGLAMATVMSRSRDFLFSNEEKKCIIMNHERRKE